MKSKTKTLFNFLFLSIFLFSYSPVSAQLAVNPAQLKLDFDSVAIYCETSMTESILRKVDIDTTNKAVQKQTVYTTSGSVLDGAKMAVDHFLSPNNIHIVYVERTLSSPVALWYDHIPENNFNNRLQEVVPLRLGPGEDILGFDLQVGLDNNAGVPFIVIATYDSVNLTNNLYLADKRNSRWSFKQLLSLPVNGPPLSAFISGSTLDMHLSNTPTGQVNEAEIIFTYIDFYNTHRLYKVNSLVNPPNTVVVDNNFSTPQNIYRPGTKNKIGVQTALFVGENPNLIYLRNKNALGQWQQPVPLPTTALYLNLMDAVVPESFPGLSIALVEENIFIGGIGITAYVMYDNNFILSFPVLPAVRRDARVFPYIPSDLTRVNGQLSFGDYNIAIQQSRNVSSDVEYRLDLHAIRNFQNNSNPINIELTRQVFNPRTSQWVSGSFIDFDTIDVENLR
jgi:hypothetical protein